MVLREWYRDRAARKRAEERTKTEALLKEEFEKGVERGRQLEREEQSARRNGNNRNGNRED